MKYKAIYDVLERSHTHISYEHSGWRIAHPTYIEMTNPLWIVAEAPALNLRLWIVHTCGRLSVSTADMRFDSNSRDYAQSRKYFRTQAELAAYLRKLLLPQEGGDGGCVS